MPSTPRLALAERIAAELRRLEGKNLIAVGVFGSVATSTDRLHSDLDLLAVLRRKPRSLRMECRDGTLVSVLRMSTEEARAEVLAPSPYLPEILSGWRTVRALYDRTGLLRKLRARARRPRVSLFRESAGLAILGALEDYGKLRNAVCAKSRGEAREMAIWFTGAVIQALFCLERRVPRSGRTLFIDGRKLPQGFAVWALRYRDLSLGDMNRRAQAIWRGVSARAREQGIRLEGLPGAPGESRPRV